MSAFDDLIDEYTGDQDSLADIRTVVRQLYFYDFQGYPVRVWQGQGKLFTADGAEWLGSIDSAGTDHHTASAIQDGRDGTSATYTFGLEIPDMPGENVGEMFDALKADQWRVSGQSLRIYLAVFKEGEALRPSTPIKFLKELTMIAPKFSERIDSPDGKSLLKKYVANLTAKDANFGRALKPMGTYTDTIQKRRAVELGVALDRGCEFVGALANHTFVLP